MNGYYSDTKTIDLIGLSIGFIISFVSFYVFHHRNNKHLKTTVLDYNYIKKGFEIVTTVTVAILLVTSIGLLIICIIEGSLHGPYYFVSWGFNITGVNFCIWFISYFYVMIRDIYIHIDKNNDVQNYSETDETKIIIEN